MSRGLLRQSQIRSKQPFKVLLSTSPQLNPFLALVLSRLSPNLLLRARTLLHDRPISFFTTSLTQQVRYPTTSCTFIIALPFSYFKSSPQPIFPTAQETEAFHLLPALITSSFCLGLRKPAFYFKNR